MAVSEYMFMNINTNKLVLILLISIVILASILRLYKLDQVPPSLSWDEAAFGVNAWTIANYGRDEYGKIFPLYFHSFGDDKHPVHIYITTFFTKLLDLNEFSTRFPAALFGILNVLIIYLVAKVMFEKKIIGLIAAFFLAISPYSIHFSRFNHELNFALFFYLLGLLLFFKTIKDHKKFLPYSILSFGICFLTYHPSKLIVPASIMILTFLYWRNLILLKRQLLYSLSVGILFLIIVVLNPPLLGLARFNQNSLNPDDIKRTPLFKQTNNELLGKLNLVAIQYSWHFTPQYLFINGDKNPRLSSQTGEFYKLDALLLIIGIIFLVLKKSRENIFLLFLSLIAPLPSAVVAEAPHAARSSFMMGSWHMITAIGFYSLISVLKKIVIRWVVIAIVIAILTLFLKSYLEYYFGEYAIRYAIDWQYGMKEIVEFVRDHPEYDQIYTTDVRFQPHIFFLYYLKTPLPQYLNSVILNNSESKDYNNVAYFESLSLTKEGEVKTVALSFGGWDPIESFPNQGVLYVLTPSQYDGLKHKQLFDVKKIIYYPNGTTAFFLISVL